MKASVSGKNMEIVKEKLVAAMFIALCSMGTELKELSIFSKDPEDE